MTFETIRIYRVQKIDGHALHNLIENTHATIKISFQLARHRAVIQRLRQFAPGDLSIRDEDEASHASPRCVGGHRGGSIARGGAGYPMKSFLTSERRGHSHARVLERSGRIHSLMLGQQLLHSGDLGAGRHFVKRCVAFAQSDGFRFPVQARAGPRESAIPHSGLWPARNCLRSRQKDFQSASLQACGPHA